jgi:hypothetical protein
MTKAALSTGEKVGISIGSFAALSFAGFGYVLKPCAYAAKLAVRPNTL